MSNWQASRPTQFLGQISGSSPEWTCRVYELRASPDLRGVGRWAEPEDLLEPCLADAESEAMSDEFSYLRCGAFLVHFGRRGVTATLLHFGYWGDMPEAFMCGWYAYRQSPDSLELLDSREPFTCFHDAPVLVHEIDTWRQLLTNQTSKPIDWDDLRTSYLNSPSLAV